MGYYFKKMDLRHQLKFVEQTVNRQMGLFLVGYLVDYYIGYVFIGKYDKRIYIYIFRIFLLFQSFLYIQ